MRISRRKTPLFSLAIAVVMLAACSGPAARATPMGPEAAAATANARGLLDTYRDVERVTLRKAKAAFDAGSAVFLDVRPPWYFNNDLIAGALHIPITELTSRLGELDKDAWIITYCG